MEILLAESRFIKYGFYAVYAGAVYIIVIISARVSWYWALLLIPVLLYASWILRRDVQRTADDSITALRIEAGGRLFVRTGHVGWIPCEVRSWWAGQRLLLMSLKCKGDSGWPGGRSLMVDGDTLEAAHFRKLRVWLRGL